MPIMELLGNDKEDIIRIFSYMYYPGDKERRDELVFVLGHLDDIDSCESDFVSFPRDIVRKLINSSSPEYLRNEVENIFHKGCIQVGTMLHNLLCLESISPKNASLNNAILLMQEQHKKTSPNDNNSKIKSLTSTSYWGYWRQYKSVSHLWGAWISFSVEAYFHGYSGDIPCKTFLLESERYRLLGENHIDNKTKKPALPPGECWVAPEDYLLPPRVETIKPFRPDAVMADKMMAVLAAKGKQK